MTPDTGPTAATSDEVARPHGAVERHIAEVQRRCSTRLCQVEHSIGSDTFGPIADVDLVFLVADALSAVPDGWAKVEGEWIRITSDGVGYGEFDRDTSIGDSS